MGDIVKSKFNSYTYTIKEVSDTQYVLVETVDKYRYVEDIEAQVHWELVPNKFDITTLKPFDKVLVRDNDKQKWTVDYFSFADKEQVYPFICVGHYVSQCIPYNGNEHLLGTTDDCDEYYKTWE